MIHLALVFRHAIVVFLFVAASAQAIPVSFTFEGQLASGSEGAFEDNADYSVTFLLDNGGTSFADQTFDVTDFLSVVLVSGMVEWNWEVTNSTVPFFAGFQTNSLGQLVMGNGIFRRADLYDLATFASSPFGAASLDGNDRANSSESNLISLVGAPVAVQEPHMLTLLVLGLSGLALSIKRVQHALTRGE